MIRLRDAAVLAHTKLRMHRVRTGITIGISGVLFGLLIGVVLVVQGVFESVGRFSDSGLNNRYVVLLGRTFNSPFNAYDSLEDPGFVAEVEAAHEAIVAKKQAAAKQYHVSYDAKTEDPSPVTVNAETKKKVISEHAQDSAAVRQVASQRIRQDYTPFHPQEALSAYPSAKVLSKYRLLYAQDGYVSYMRGGKEQALTEVERKTAAMGFISNDEDRALSILPQTLAEPFISNPTYDPNSGELPLIIAYNDAEKLLGFKPLPNTATARQQRDRASEVHSRSSEIVVSYCYRNTASESLVNQAKEARREMEANKANKDYKKPSLIYQVPDAADCGPVNVLSDTRTNVEKQAAENQLLYQRAIRERVAEPAQQKLVFRVVGVSSDGPTGSAQWSVRSILQGVLSSSLGYATWNIPAGLLAKTPESVRPAAVFGDVPDDAFADHSEYTQEAYLAEFGDRNEARAYLKTMSAVYASPSTNMVMGSPFGSSSLAIDELRELFYTAFSWVVLVVGVIAAIILSGLTGRAIADSRKETAVFRAIGATRLDMALVYAVYTVLFSLRIALFAFVLGSSLAVIVQVLYAEEATTATQLAFGAVDSTKQFSFIGLQNWYLPAILSIILVVGLVAVILPLLRNIRRNPIRDMRDE